MVSDLFSLISSSTNSLNFNFKPSCACLYSSSSTVILGSIFMLGKTGKDYVSNNFNWKKIADDFKQTVLKNLNLI